MNDPSFSPVALTTIVAQSEAPDQYTLICLGGRPGALRFFTLLEWTHFPPKTPANHDFHFTLMQWPDTEGLIWIVVIMPLAIQTSVHSIADQTGMRVVNGVPMLLGADGPQRFPIYHDRAWSLENDPKSPLYLPGGDQFIRDEEGRWMAQFFKEKGIPWP